MLAGCGVVQVSLLRYRHEGDLAGLSRLCHFFTHLLRDLGVAVVVRDVVEVEFLLLVLHRPVFLDDAEPVADHAVVVHPAHLDVAFEIAVCVACGLEVFHLHAV